MENKKDIGKAFREKLDQLDKSPNKDLWVAIHADLQKKKKRRVIFIPFWMKMAGIFLSGALFTVFVMNDSVRNPFATVEPSDGNHPGIYKSDGNSIGKYDNTVGNTNRAAANHQNENAVKNAKAGDGNAFIKKSENNIEPETADNKPVTANHKKNTKNASEATGLKLKIGTNSENSIIAKHGHKPGRSALAAKTSSEKYPGKSIPKKEQANPKEKNELSIAEKNPITGASGSNIQDTENKTAAAETPLQKTDSVKTKKDKVALKQPPETEKDSAKTKEKNSFNLFVYGSPTYTGLISDTSPIDKRLANNPVKSKIMWSYGAYLSYDVTPKWSLRFGVGMTNLKLITENAPINTSNYKYINYTKNTNASIYSQSDNSLMAIVQDISYIEIPLELKYAIINKKFGVNAFGGISYMFRGKNSVTAETQNEMRFTMGEMKNLAPSSYSIHLGVGVDYKFSKRLRFNFEPVFKYHLVDYKDTGKVNPYTIGILTGLQFSLIR